MTPTLPSSLWSPSSPASNLSLGCSCWTFGGCFEPKAPVLASEEASFFFHSLVLGTVVDLLVVVAKVVSARDALEIMGPSRRCQQYSNYHQGSLPYSRTPRSCGCLGYLTHRGWSSEPFTGRPLSLTANHGVCWMLGTSR